MSVSLSLSLLSLPLGYFWGSTSETSGLVDIPKVQGKVVPEIDSENFSYKIFLLLQGKAKSTKLQHEPSEVQLHNLKKKNLI